MFFAVYQLAAEAESQDPQAAALATSSLSSSEEARLRSQIADLEARLDEAVRRGEEAGHRAETLQGLLTSLLPAGPGASRMFAELLACRQERDALTRQHQAQLDQLQHILQQVYRCLSLRPPSDTSMP